MTRLPHDPEPGSGDIALRALYLQAQDGISAATTARLHRARHAAACTRPRPARSWAWPAAAGLAALCVLAIGMQLNAPPAVEAPATSAIAPLAAAEEAVRDQGAADAFSAYEESPDFYLWLATSDAALLALE